ncbi:MAG TPA: TldD/PmbA family protein [Candidatus Eisenbacteria bacterium]|nr:TldD/PmbA family protein [Candidatus Eisenbacteria bacterium]
MSLASDVARAPGDREALARLAADAVARARRAGADEAEALIEHTHAFTVRVHGGAIESLKQSGTLGLGLRVIAGRRVGFVSGNDLRPESLDDLAAHAVALSRYATADEANALPTPDEAGTGDAPDLELDDPAIAALAPERRIEMALTLERVALAADPRIHRTDGAHVSTHFGDAALANSHGVARAWGASAIRAYVVPLADDRDGKQQSGAYGMVQRQLRDLADLEAIAREAARRAVARIGARPVPTARVPVVLHPDVAGAWIAEMHAAFGGDQHLKGTSWLLGRVGSRIGSELFTLVDDGRMAKGAGSEPWDGEGVATRRNVLVDRGRMAMLLYDTYHAHRAGARSTGSAVRSYAGVPFIGPHTLYVAAGTDSPEAILSRVDRGFYMDDQGSYGFDDVTGDYSYQAQGFWVERGEKRFPVEGVTVASNSLDMLDRIVAVGSDLEFESSIASPTLLIGEMTISGS